MHVEPTSRCVLACPGCARTWFSDFTHRPFPKHDLDLDDFERFLDCDSSHQIKSFLLNGNHGDPIYYPRLIEMIQKFRSKNFQISTNGSYMNAEFWQELGDNLLAGDTVYFSIDGLEHNNHLYRKNADWASIMTGISILSQSAARVVWKSIIFSFNQDQLGKMEDMAHDLGVEFFAEPTGYFGDEKLKPNNTQLIRTDMLYRSDPGNIEIDPRCQSAAETAYVTADGYFWPCCLISNSFVLYKTPIWRTRQQWMIKNQTLDEALVKIQEWADLAKGLAKESPASCQMHCKKGQTHYKWPTI